MYLRGKPDPADPVHLLTEWARFHRSIRRIELRERVACGSASYHLRLAERLEEVTCPDCIERATTGRYRVPASARPVGSIGVFRNYLLEVYSTAKQPETIRKLCRLHYGNALEFNAIGEPEPAPLITSFDSGADAP